jgi:predicted metal-dependent hydrolase
MTQPAHPDDILPRNLRFGIRENADRAWFGGDPVLSALFDGFAVLLPLGERFFIRSLRPFESQLRDPALVEAMHAFAAQEAFHTREHEAYNDALRSLGHDVEAMEAKASRLLGGVKGPVTRLLVTCAIEQMTFALARFILKRPALMDRAAPAYRRLWRWHALEEVEHAAVAVQVLRAVDSKMPAWRRYLSRVAILFVAVSSLVTFALQNVAMILQPGGGRLSWRLRLRLLWVLLGSPGFLRGLVVPCLAYCRPGYAGGGGAADAGLVAEGRRLLEVDPPLAEPRPA